MILPHPFRATGVVFATVARARRRLVLRRPACEGCGGTPSSTLRPGPIKAADLEMYASQRSVRFPEIGTLPRDLAAPKSSAFDLREAVVRLAHEAIIGMSPKGDPMGSFIVDDLVAYVLDAPDPHRALTELLAAVEGLTTSILVDLAELAHPSSTEISPLTLSIVGRTRLQRIYSEVLSHGTR